MKTIKDITILLLFMAIGLCSGCKKDPVMYNKGIDSFKFIVNDSKGIPQEYQGKISATEIVVELPVEVDITCLKASFTVDNPRTIVQVGNQVQESGITEQDFSQPVSYKIKAEDKSSRSYTVRIEKKTALKSFGFYKEDNAGFLEDDYKAVIRGLKIDIYLPETADLSKLVARFETTQGLSLKVAGVLQESKKTANNFSSPVTYTLQEASLTGPVEYTTSINFVGPQWYLISDPGLIFPKATGLKMSISPVNNFPCVVYQRTGKDENGATIEPDNRKIAAIRYTGTGWENLGSSMGISDFRADFAGIGFDSQGIPYIGYRDYFAGEQKSTVIKFVNGNWENVGPKRFTQIKIDKQSFTVGENDEPYLSAISSTDVPGFPKRALYVAGFYSGSWTVNTPAGGLSVGSTNIFKGADGKIYLAAMDRTNKANIFKLVNRIWTAVGQTSFNTTDGLPGYTSINGAADQQGNVYAVYQTVVSSQRMNRVLKYNKTTNIWEELAGAGSSQGETDKYSLAVHPNGTVFFAYANNSGLFFRTFNTKTNNWNTARLVIAGKINEFDMQISATGIPYLVASLPSPANSSSNDRTVVYKYTITK